MASSAIPQRVIVYTVDELMEIGLLLEGESIARQNRQKRETRIEDFKACYGVHPKVLAEIWVALQINPTAANRIQTRKNSANIIKFLKTYKFLHQYPTELQHKVNTGRSRKTNRKWTWYFIERIKALKEHKVSGQFPQQNSGTRYARSCSLSIFISSTDCLARGVENQFYNQRGWSALSFS
jgi:hypothetical protein